MSVNSSELTAKVKVRAKVRNRDRVRIKIRVRVRVRVKVRVSVNNDNSGAGELTDKYHSGIRVSPCPQKNLRICVRGLTRPLSAHSCRIFLGRSRWLPDAKHPGTIALCCVALAKSRYIHNRRLQ